MIPSCSMAGQNIAGTELSNRMTRTMLRISIGIGTGKGRYRIGDLTASGSRNGESGMPWRGIDPGSRHWAPSRSFPGGEGLPVSTHAALDALDDMGRIRWPERGGKPGFKRYLHEMHGSAVQDVVTDIRPLSHARE